MIANCYCCPEITTEDFKNIFEILALLGTFIGSWFYIHYKFAPIILLDMDYEWADQETGKVILKIRVENKSKVRVRVERKGFLLQILEYDANRNSLSEWVPISKDDKHNEADEMPPDSTWHEPIRNFMRSTKYMYPGEFTTQHRLATCPKGKLLHILLQFKNKPTLFFPGESWAITRIILNPLTADEPGINNLSIENSNL